MRSIVIFIGTEEEIAYDFPNVIDETPKWMGELVPNYNKTQPTETHA